MPVRGDHAGAADRLAAIPQGRLRVEGIAAPDGGAREGASCGGPGLVGREGLCEPALRLLKTGYHWAAHTLGELPAERRANMARALA